MSQNIDPRRPLPDDTTVPAEDDARNTAGDMNAGDPMHDADEQDAARGDAIAAGSAREVSDQDTVETAEAGEADRGEAVDAHDVAGDTLGASR